MIKINPVMTIVIPTFNSAAYLKKTLNCLFRQSFKSFNVLLIDDRSLDATIKIAQEFQQQLNLTIINKPKRIRSGAAASLNYALKYVKTPAIGLIDADAYLSPSWVGVMWQHLQAEKIAGAPILSVKSNGWVAYLVGLEIESRYQHISKKYLKHLSTCNLAAWTKIFRRIKLDESLDYAYDHHLSFQLRQQKIQFYLAKNTYCRHGNKSSLAGFFIQQFKIAYHHFHLARQMPKEALEGDEISPSYIIFQPIVLIGAIGMAFIYWPVSVFLLGVLIILNFYQLNYIRRKIGFEYLLPVIVLIVIKNSAWILGFGLGLLRR